MSIISKINNLIKKANETTKKQDTDLTSAIKRLIDGYGSGSSDVVKGTMTFATKDRMTHIPRINGAKNVVVYRNDIADMANPSSPASGASLGALAYLDQMSVRVSSSLSDYGCFRITTASGYLGFLPTGVSGANNQITDDEFIIDTGHANYAFEPNKECTYIQW